MNDDELNLPAALGSFSKGWRILQFADTAFLWEARTHTLISTPRELACRIASCDAPPETPLSDVFSPSNDSRS
jgi:hypothetical protein